MSVPTRYKYGYIIVPTLGGCPLGIDLNRVPTRQAQSILGIRNCVGAILSCVASNVVVAMILAQVKVNDECRNDLGRRPRADTRRMSFIML